MTLDLGKRHRWADEAVLILDDLGGLSFSGGIMGQQGLGWVAPVHLTVIAALLAAIFREGLRELILRANRIMHYYDIRTINDAAVDASLRTIRIPRDSLLMRVVNLESSAAEDDGEVGGGVKGEGMGFFYSIDRAKVSRSRTSSPAGSQSQSDASARRREQRR